MFAPQVNSSPKLTVVSSLTAPKYLEICEVKVLKTLESTRLAALDQLPALETSDEQLFNSLAELASLTFNAPIALIYLIDEKRQWIKAQYGLDADHISGEISFCHHTIIADDVIVVSNAAEDGRFSDDSLVTGSSHVRFYAGAPLITPDGHRLGTICIFDKVARPFAEADVLRLRVIAKSVMGASLLRSDRRERERLSSVVALQNKLLTLAEDMAGVGTWSWDVAADRTTWSDQVYRIHGYEPDVEPPALQGVLDRYHPSDAKLLAAHVQRAVAEGLDYALQARVYRPDGAERHVIARGACRIDEDGRVSALVGTFQDITEHVADEKFVRALTDHLPGLVGYWDTQLRCRFANAAYEEWFGQSQEHMSGTSLPELLGTERFAQVEHYVVAALNGETHTFPRTLVKFDGTVAQTLTHYIPDVSASGLTQGFFVLVSDVTALKRAEEKLIEVAAEREKLIDELTTLSATRDDANKALALANQILGDNETKLEALVAERTAALRTEINNRRIMATAVAHELNQPLAAILGFLQTLTLLADRGDASTTMLSTVSDLSQRASSQAIRAGDILKLLRNSITRDNSVRTDEDIGIIIEETLATALADAEGLDVTLKCNGSARSAHAIVNRTQIRQVLGNLIQNAVEAVSGTDQREVTVTLSHDQGTKVIRVDVADSGPGISPEVAKGLFMPFLSNKPHGMGIGLSISREIIEEHQGKLTMSPNPRGGAIFSIVLPSDELALAS